MYEEKCALPNWPGLYVSKSIDLVAYINNS